MNQVVSNLHLMVAIIKVAIIKVAIIKAIVISAAMDITIG